MSRLLTWAGLVAVVAASLVMSLDPSGRATSLESQVDAVAAGLRCPVCQGLSVKDSDSQTARNIRDDVSRRLAAGEGPSEVRQAYVDRYGRWILLRPATGGLEGLVWAVPAGAVAGGAVALGAGFWRWRRQGGRRVPTTDDQQLVAAALGTGRTGDPVR